MGGQQRDRASHTARKKSKCRKPQINAGTLVVIWKRYEVQWYRGQGSRPHLPFRPGTPRYTQKDRANSDESKVKVPKQCSAVDQTAEAANDFI